MPVGYSSIIGSRLGNSLNTSMLACPRASIMKRRICNAKQADFKVANKENISIKPKKDYSLLKTAGIAVAAAFIAYKGKNVIAAMGRGMRDGAISFKNFLSTHTRGSVHEALGGIYHTFAGTGKIITAPFRGIAKAIHRAPKP